MTTPTSNPTLIIGLVGPAGSGKNTVAEMLMDAWCDQARPALGMELAFADPIRAMLCPFMEYAGVSDPHTRMTDRVQKEEPIPSIDASYRHLAQTLGTEWGQQCVGRDVWIKLLHTRMKAAIHQGVRRFVVTDARFAVETDWLRAQGGVIWRIDRPGLKPVREHVSELGMTQIRSDRVIPNDGSLDQLRRTVGLELARLHYEKGLAA